MNSEVFFGLREGSPRLKIIRMGSSGFELKGVVSLRV
jgi:hypothetical protein